MLRVKFLRHYKACKHEHGRSDLRLVLLWIQERGKEFRVGECHIWESDNEFECEELHILSHTGDMIQLEHVPELLAHELDDVLRSIGDSFRPERRGIDLGV